MLGTPDVTVFGTAHRPQFWMELYRSIGDNDLNFEVVFVGPNEPDYKLPDNFRFIKSNTKPTQCLEIASRNAAAEFIINIPDDSEFVTEKPLDALYKAYKSYDNDKLLLSCRLMTDGLDISDKCQRFFIKDLSSPTMPVCGFLAKKLYREVGGIDRNFIAVMWDLDVAMRIFALGGEVLLSDVYVDEHKIKTKGSLLCREFRCDRRLVERLWSVNGKTHFNRARPFEPFSDFRILEDTQGPKGRW